MGSIWVRRPLTITGVAVAAIVLVVLAPLWVPVTVAMDLVRGRWHCPTARFVAFGACWCWLETIGVLAAGVFFLVGQSGNRDLHYLLQRWWAARLIGSLRLTLGLRITVEGADRLGKGPFIALCRHASLADALISAWVFGTHGGLRPRYVLKRELAMDPCLDVVGHRLPNYFVNRGSANVAAELVGIERMADRLGEGEVAVIFPEGTRANDAKRRRELERLAKRAPERARRLGALRHLLPPKPAGAGALLAAVPGANVITMWHVGFDGMDTFSGILRRLGERKVRARIVITEHVRSTVSAGESLVDWLDTRWLEMDDAVARVLSGPQSHENTGGLRA